MRTVRTARDQGVLCSLESSSGPWPYNTRHANALYMPKFGTPTLQQALNMYHTS